MIKFPELTEEQKKRIGENLKNNRVINECAKAIISTSIELGADYFYINLKDTQYEGVYSGDWKITVEQIKQQSMSISYYRELPEYIAKEYDAIDFRSPLKGELFLSESGLVLVAAHTKTWSNVIRTILQGKPIMSIEPEQVEVSVKFKIPASIAKEWDVIDYRHPQKEETFLQWNYPVVCHSIYSGNDQKFFIIRPKWKWPEWLTAAAIAMDEDGSIYIHEHMPNTSCGSVWDNDGNVWNMDDEQPFHLDVPTITDWKSPVYNPNYKAPQ